MKKIAGFLFIAALGFMISCGPSAKQIEEKRIADSTAMAMYNDSITSDSIAQVAIKAKADSIIADSVAKATKKTKKIKK